ncbi:MAG: AAA family ATPase [Paracoccaceae bacterium]|nr:AAA family ATPase [Paracoccaceae bacterium]
MADIVKLSSLERTKPVLGGFVKTEAAVDIHRTLNKLEASGGGEMALIVGQPGCGKTQAMRAFKSATPGAVSYNVTAGEGGAFCAAQELMRVLDMGEPNARKLADERRRIGEEIGAGNMLMVDEAQYVVQHNTRGADSWLALEWFRSMADECGINIALIGDLFLLGMEMALPQLWGRVSTNRPVIIRETSKADVAVLAASFRIQDATSLQVLRSVSKRGGLRQVANCCRHAWVISGGQQPKAEDIGAAVEDLKIFDMRGK